MGGRWHYDGETEGPLPAAGTVGGMLRACGEQGWELITTPESSAGPWVFKRHHRPAGNATPVGAPTVGDLLAEERFYMEPEDA